MFSKMPDGSGMCLANRVAWAAAHPIGTKSTRGSGNDPHSLHVHPKQVDRLETKAANLGRDGPNLGRNPGERTYKTYKTPLGDPVVCRFCRFHFWPFSQD